ncbi:MAG: hypothetical protein ACLFQI_12410 [Halochromatium sp.]|uniref:hypothetical protein n=2 Tax=Halochromatium sp. TaxID=2049430 RepID=UPI00397C53B2
MSNEYDRALMQAPIAHAPAAPAGMQAPIAYAPAAPAGDRCLTSEYSLAASSDRCSALGQLAIMGAVIGGSAAAGANIRRLQRQEIDAVGALADTGRAALATAAASAVAGAAASAVQRQGLVRLGVLFATGSAVMYGIQRYLERDIEQEVEP